MYSPDLLYPFTPTKGSLQAGIIRLLVPFNAIVFDYIFSRLLCQAAIRLSKNRRQE